ncbi:Putative 6-phosphogluconate dehydrogenase, NADP-binding, 6-phosphogluconate dehydrogenase, domain 2 [Septoria linicola]|uniref:6-phosphogluconate dehydrogenase, NADP-binding, 6-phosphogluconate dehydrogenase, domain 2 n=1 Tax=Septoria linicola TaxID=215465 RepID=A0A9Q9AR12_9PEZI|nr:putative 6-phosphogluconate dehydrogenase, NADP-binding, 6-phosphogluconate dehydrogenase, domain 2 [Septoria linicola]USW54142.1 Putative 6-phosphogluconate dehydrogenase, NADP-binding, 6-phosphogluconate dehydrogenase, domain 2 [Septoria linicola]
MASPKLAWIGLGNMGRGMVKNIVEKGTFTGPVLVYNRTTARTEKLVSELPEGKAKVVTSIAEAVQGADIIFACLSNDAAIQETIKAALATPEAKGKLFVDCSTVHPDTTNELAKSIKDAGADFVACPVFGAPAMADNGQLVCVLAGSKSLVDRVLPYCTGVMGRAEINYSDQPHGAATHLKIIGNTFILAMVEALSEGHTLAEKSGLGVDNLHAFITTMFPGPYSAYSTRLMSGDYYNREEPLFAAKLARKDANHARSLANACGVKMNGLEVADEHLRQVVEHAGDKGDIAGIYGAVRKESGLKFENK